MNALYSNPKIYNSLHKIHSFDQGGSRGTLAFQEIILGFYETSCDIILKLN